jgi:hypothetical protein
MSQQPLFYMRSEPNPKNHPAQWLPGFETEEQVADRYAKRGRLMFKGNRCRSRTFIGARRVALATPPRARCACVPFDAGGWMLA